ncbi:MAG TPA: adenosine-specific kinase [Candidatus Omnitrophota bacterium]|nr:adenosine-specific kinase [Candidatus Omnitrophota bacterium]HPD84413.1 adenosine-specific kinase [Candidatus Omnitrophota bacterium]HRZ03271.1 adenosine-specific kinase [Candidatus Omnitrophota bacterium]
MEIKNIRINKPEDVNVILGQSHFIKTVEDIYEAIVSAAPEMKFGLAFCEASGACLVRLEGNDDELKKLAADNALEVGSGHSFMIFMRKGFPVNILNQIKNVAEVCSVFAATANTVEVVVADNGAGRGILGVIDGVKPKGIEDAKGAQWRKDLLRKLGYKR